MIKLIVMISKMSWRWRCDFWKLWTTTSSFTIPIGLLCSKYKKDFFPVSLVACYVDSYGWSLAARWVQVHGSAWYGQLSISTWQCPTTMSFAFFWHDCTTDGAWQVYLDLMYPRVTIRNIVVHSNLGHRLYSSSVLELVSYGYISSHFLLLFSGADCCKMRAWQISLPVPGATCNPSPSQFFIQSKECALVQICGAWLESSSRLSNQLGWNYSSYFVCTQGNRCDTTCT